MMAGDQDLTDEILETAPSESNFRYADLTFDGADKDKYNNLQTLIKTLKRAHTTHINSNLTDAREKHNQPHTLPLALAVESLRKYQNISPRKKTNKSQVKRKP